MERKTIKLISFIETPLLYRLFKLGTFRLLGIFWHKHIEYFFDAKNSEWVFLYE